MNTISKCFHTKNGEVDEEVSYISNYIYDYINAFIIYKYCR